jgi:hypothetical protein
MRNKRDSAGDPRHGLPPALPPHCFRPGGSRRAGANVLILSAASKATGSRRGFALFLGAIFVIPIILLFV